MVSRVELNEFFSWPVTNLLPRLSHLPVERPWLSLVTCLPESERLQTNVFGEGQISVRFVSAKRRWKVLL